MCVVCASGTRSFPLRIVWPSRKWLVIDHTWIGRGEGERGARERGEREREGPGEGVSGTKSGTTIYICSLASSQASKDAGIEAIAAPTGVPDTPIKTLPCDDVLQMLIAYIDTCLSPHWSSGYCSGYHE